MQHRRSLIYILALTVPLISGQDPICEPVPTAYTPYGSNGWCKVTNFTNHGHQPAQNSSTTPKLLLVAFQPPSIEPWLQDHFRNVTQLAIVKTNVSSLYIFPTLRNLFVSASQVDEIVVDPVESNQLETIFLFESIVTLPEKMTNFTRLATVKVVVSLIPSINLSTFDGLSNLTFLQFRETHTKSFIIPADINLPSLKTLNLDFNQLETLPKNINRLEGLEEISLLFNKMTHIATTAFNGLNNLRVINLSHNSIARVTSPEVVTLPKLEEFTLSYNDLTELDVQHWQMPQLKMLVLTANNLAEVMSNASLPSGVQVKF